MKTVMKFILIQVLACISINNVFADENWYVSATVNGMAGNYSDSDFRDNLLSAGAWLNIDYIDIYSFAIAYNHLSVGYFDTSTGDFSINQESIAGRFRYNFYNDTLAGKITAQLVLHGVANDSPSIVSDDILIVAPKVIYTSYSKKLSLDFEYVNSSYSNSSNNSEFSIQQFSPSVKFGFNNNSDWIQVKAFWIESSDSNFTFGEESLKSVKVKWLHEFYSPVLFGINEFFIDALTGDRVFAVDNETFSVFNLEGVQQDSVSLGLGWRFGETVDVTAVAGIENYENKLIDDTYSREYLYVYLTKHW